MTLRQYNLQKKYSRYNSYIKYRQFIPKVLRRFIEAPIASPSLIKRNFDFYISVAIIAHVQ